MPVAPDTFIDELWGIARQVPMLEHPGSAASSNTAGRASRSSSARCSTICACMEELGGERTHVDIMLQFLEEAGISREEADQADAAPGTLAAIEMIVGACQRRSALEGLALLAFVEDQHGGANGVAARVYREMVGHYGFSARAAETYHLHAEQDEGHGGRQIDAIRRFATTDEMQARIRGAVQLGTWAFNFEWDGHVQAMTGQREHWGGVGQLELRQPRSSADKPVCGLGRSRPNFSANCRRGPWPTKSSPR